MNINRQSRDFTKAEAYKLTHNRSVSLKDVAGQKLTVTDWIQYSDRNQRGEDVEVLVLVTDDGYYSTISQTFDRDFADIAEAFDLPVEITVIGGKTKNGRDFITCELA